MQLSKITHNSAWILVSGGLLLTAIILWVFSMRQSSLSAANSQGSTRSQQFVSGALPENYSNGAWIWESPRNLGIDEFTRMMQFAQENNIKTVYLFIEDYLGIIEDPKLNDEKREQKLKELNAKVARLLTIAREHDVEVEGLAGNVDWAEFGHEYIPETLLDYVLEFNRTNSEKFAGMQFDIEFYNQSNFKRSKSRYTINYLNLIKELRAQVAASGQINFRLGLAIPHGLERKDGLVPEVDFDGKNQNAFSHLLNILSETNSYLVIMAYRNFAQGNNGSVEISEDAVDLAEQSVQTANNKDFKIYIGMETVDVSPRHITFYGKTKVDVHNAATEITDQFKDKNVYAGIAIHTLTAYRELD